MNRIGINFISYTMMLYQSGMIALGRIPNPLEEEVELEIEEARSIIDLLDLLKEKTKGNLNDEEIRALESVTESLKAVYVEELSKAATGNKEKGAGDIEEGDDFEVH